MWDIILTEKLFKGILEKRISQMVVSKLLDKHTDYNIINVKCTNPWDEARHRVGLINKANIGKGKM